MNTQNDWQELDRLIEAECDQDADGIRGGRIESPADGGLRRRAITTSTA